MPLHECAQPEGQAEPHPDDDCNCISMYLAGASPGWWCPLHKDRKADPSATEALRKQHDKLCAIEQTVAGTGLFDEWMQNPYTKVLMESMDRDYMPRVDAEAQLQSEAYGITDDEIRTQAVRILPNANPFDTLYTFSDVRLCVFARAVLAAAKGKP